MGNAYAISAAAPRAARARLGSRAAPRREQLGGTSIAIAKWERDSRVERGNREHPANAAGGRAARCIRRRKRAPGLPGARDRIVVGIPDGPHRSRTSAVSHGRRARDRRARSGARASPLIATPVHAAVRGSLCEGTRSRARRMRQRRASAAAWARRTTAHRATGSSTRYERARPSDRKEHRSGRGASPSEEPATHIQTPEHCRGESERHQRPGDRAQDGACIAGHRDRYRDRARTGEK